MAGIGRMGLVVHALIALVLLASTAVNAAGAAQESRLSPVDRVPEIAEMDLSDTQGRVSRLKLIHGKVNIIHFWASWCTPCREELPALSELARLPPFSSINIIAIAADSHRAVEQFSDNHPLPGIVLIDQYGKAMNAYQIRVLPTSYVTDRSANVIYQSVGKLDWNSPMIKKILQRLLERP